MCMSSLGVPSLLESDERLEKPYLPACSCEIRRGNTLGSFHEGDLLAPDSNDDFHVL
jgi:hypothetical protein